VVVKSFLEMHIGCISETLEQAWIVSAFDGHLFFSPSQKIPVAWSMCAASRSDWTGYVGASGAIDLKIDKLSPNLYDVNYKIVASSIIYSS
jgi:hypothetical protein